MHAHHKQYNPYMSSSYSNGVPTNNSQYHKLFSNVQFKSVEDRVITHLYHQYDRKMNQPIHQPDTRLHTDSRMKQFDKYMQQNSTKRPGKSQYNSNSNNSSKIFSQQTKYNPQNLGYHSHWTYKDQYNNFSKKLKDPSDYKTASDIMGQYRKLREKMPLVSEDVIQSDNSLLGHHFTFQPNSSNNFRTTMRVPEIQPELQIELQTELQPEVLLKYGVKQSGLQRIPSVGESKQLEQSLAFSPQRESPTMHSPNKFSFNQTLNQSLTLPQNITNRGKTYYFVKFKQ